MKLDMEKLTPEQKEQYKRLATFAAFILAGSQMGFEMFIKPLFSSNFSEKD